MHGHTTNTFTFPFSIHRQQLLMTYRICWPWNYACHSGRVREIPLHGSLTPLHPSVCEAALQDHPNWSFAEYICTGLWLGFRICLGHYAMQHVLSPEPIALRGSNKCLGCLTTTRGDFSLFTSAKEHNI